MRKSFLIVTILLTATAAFAQTPPDAHTEHQMPAVAPANPAVADWAKQRLAASPRHREWVKVKSGNREVNAFVVYPEVKNKATSVVVIHEIFGMSDWVQLVSDEVAEAGYIAIAPDLLSGMGPLTDPTAVGQGDPRSAARSDHRRSQRRRRLRREASRGWKVAVAGFCWGGGQAFRFATNRPTLAAAFVFYGPAPIRSMRSKRRCTGSMPATMRGSAPLSPKRWR